MLLVMSNKHFRASVGVNAQWQPCRLTKWQLVYSLFSVFTETCSKKHLGHRERSVQGGWSWSWLPGSRSHPHKLPGRNQGPIQHAALDGTRKLAASPLFNSLGRLELWRGSLGDVSPNKPTLWGVWWQDVCREDREGVCAGCAQELSRQGGEDPESMLADCLWSSQFLVHIFIAQQHSSIEYLRQVERQPLAWARSCVQIRISHIFLAIPTHPFETTLPP